MATATAIETGARVDAGSGADTGTEPESTCCGQPMEAGFIYGASSLNWFGNHERRRFAVGLGHRVTTRSFHASGAALVGHRCRSCGRLDVRPGSPPHQHGRMVSFLAIVLALVFGVAGLVTLRTGLTLLATALFLTAAVLVLATHRSPRGGRGAHGTACDRETP